MAPLSEASRPEVIEAAVDSGAEDSVVPPGLLPGELLPSPMSRAGRRYRAADGSPIPDLGQTLAQFGDADGAVCGIPFQVAQVERPLISVSRMAAAGCRVSFEATRARSCTSHRAAGCPSCAGAGCMCWSSV